MEKSGEEKTYTTFDGRTITNVDALLNDPKVQETIDKLSKNRELAHKNGRVILRRRPAR